MQQRFLRVPIIGIGGIKKSGKDTTTDYIMSKYVFDNMQFQKKSFADPLKIACKELFVFNDNQVYGTQEEKETPDPRWFGCTPRKILQYVGTDLLRDQLPMIMPELGTDIFVKSFELWYNNQQNRPVILSDVRFQNEVNYINRAGGITIRINRPSVETNDMHKSEVELKNIKNFHYEIDNVGNLNDLYHLVDSICLANGLSIF